MLRGVRQGTDWVINIKIIIRDKVIIFSLFFLRLTSSLGFPLGFFCTSIGLAYLENGRVVMMPYLWSVLGVALKLIRRNSKIEFKLDRLRELKDRVQAKG